MMGPDKPPEIDVIKKYRDYTSEADSALLQKGIDRDIEDKLDELESSAILHLEETRSFLYQIIKVLSEKDKVKVGDYIIDTEQKNTYKSCRTSKENSNIFEFFIGKCLLSELIERDSPKYRDLEQVRFSIHIRRELIRKITQSDLRERYIEKPGVEEKHYSIFYDRGDSYIYFMDSDYDIEQSRDIDYSKMSRKVDFNTYNINDVLFMMEKSKGLKSLLNKIEENLSEMETEFFDMREEVESRFEGEVVANKI